MGISTGIFKSRDKPQNATSGSAYRFFIGGRSRGKNVNERSAMQITAEVYLQLHKQEKLKVLKGAKQMLVDIH